MSHACDHVPISLVARGGAFAVLAVPAFGASSDLAASGGSSDDLTLVLAAIGILVGLAALVIALRTGKLAAHAVQEASAARARATQNHGHVSAESLAAAERVWSAKFAALEAQLQSGGRGGTVARPAIREGAPTGGDVGTRLIELEKVVAGLSAQLHQQPRRTTASPTAAQEIVWPTCLSAETSAMQDVRSALAQAVKAREPAAREVLDKLRAVDEWASKRPGTAELATALVNISSLLLTALRKGAAVAPLDGALLSDRVLAALRAAWKPVHPDLDCRSFYPGTTFDPDWMEDHTRAGLRRPVISEMLTWAVFEKTDSNRRVLSKAHVTAD